nr:MAG TPA: hypothetical protein [Caudoviricetes sp.]
MSIIIFIYGRSLVVVLQLKRKEDVLYYEHCCS